METYERKVQHILKGQQAPLIEGERHILARCAQCNRIWLQRGTRAYLSLDQAEIAQWAVRLGADIDDLLAMTCRMCALQYLGGEFTLDEYADAAGLVCGYGYSWEALDPAAHMLVGVCRLDWLETTQPQEKHYNIITDPALARAVLSWLESDSRRLARYRLFPREAIAALTRTNPPGAHAPGTELWVWSGAAWQRWCEPLGGEVSVTFARAARADEPFVLSAALADWRGVARRAQQYGIAGEP